VVCTQAPVVKQDFIVAATSLGYLKVHSFPCAFDGAEYHRLPAHVGNVIGVHVTVKVY
jgi:hypothetical protein